MITKKKVVITTTERNDFLCKFEALEYVNSYEQIYDVWQRNKTPIVVTEDVLTNFIKIPEELININKINEFIDFCHSQGFECGEFVTGIKYDTAMDRCFMCEIARYKGFSNISFYNQYVDNSVDCIIYESENFYVVPELGALKKGYLMIVPKKHFLSVAQFPRELFAEYEEVCKDVEKILLEAFDGTTVCFMEHGTGPSGKTSHKKSIVHSHVHVVVDFMLKHKFKQMVQLQPCDDITIAKDTHYFSYREGTSSQLLIVMDPQVYVQRQFPRQVMAEELGFAPDQYNWRQYDFSEITVATLYYIYKYLSEIETGRIYERTKGFVEGFPKRKRKSFDLDDEG